MSMQPTVILDTSVVVAGLRSSQGASFSLLQMIGSGRFELGLTSSIVLEYESVCMRNINQLTLDAAEIDQLLNYFCQVGKLAIVRFHVRPSVPDANDEFVLESAIASGSDWIVTHNIRDLQLGAARFGIEVIRPGEALRRLEHLS
jgi:putative PIN family toxin of toxin-antitoxin system